MILGHDIFVENPDLIDILVCTTKEGKIDTNNEWENPSQKELQVKVDIGNSTPQAMIATRATDYGMPDVKRYRTPQAEKGSKVNPSEGKEAEGEEVSDNQKETSNTHTHIDVWSSAKNRNRPDIERFVASS